MHISIQVNFNIYASYNYSKKHFHILLNDDPDVYYILPTPASQLDKSSTAYVVMSVTKLKALEWASIGLEI